MWFTKQVIGKNTIGNIAKQMALQAGLSEARTNHSGRKTAIQTLLHAGIPPTDVMQLTGHKNVQSLNSYSKLSNDQQHSISNLLSNSLSVQLSNKTDGQFVENCTVDNLSNESIIQIMDEPFEDLNHPELVPTRQQKENLLNAQVLEKKPFQVIQFVFRCINF